MDKTELENKAEKPIKEDKKVIAKADAEFSVMEKNYKGAICIKKGQDITFMIKNQLKNHQHTLKDKGVI